MKASPAPVESTRAGAGLARPRSTRSPSDHSAPSLPSVITTSRPSLASAQAAASGSRAPVSTAASSAFGSSRPARRVQPRNAAEPRSASGAAEAGSTEIDIPAARACSSATSPAEREPGSSSV